MLGKTRYFYKNNRKEQQNSACHLENQSCKHQLAQELIAKLTVQKFTFLPEKKASFQSLENAGVLNVSGNLTTKTDVQLIYRVIKMSFSGKT